VRFDSRQLVEKLRKAVDKSKPDPKPVILNQSKTALKDRGMQTESSGGESQCSYKNYCAPNLTDTSFETPGSCIVTP